MDVIAGTHCKDTKRTIEDSRRVQDLVSIEALEERPVVGITHELEGRLPSALAWLCLLPSENGTIWALLT